jgi:hypothetical protein
LLVILGCSSRVRRSFGYCDDQIARGEIAVLRIFHHLPQRLVSQDKSFLSRRRDADTVDGDFRIGAADSD